jgi:hypothetical protein
MIQPEKSSDVLAHWKFEPDLWRDFLEYESKIYKGSVRAAKHLFFGWIIFTIVVIFLISFIPFLVMGKWDSKYLQPVGGIGAVAGIFILLAGALWLYRRERMKRKAAQTGEAVISLNGVSTNGVDFNWDYLKPLVCFEKVERKRISVTPQKSFEILEFFTVNYPKINRQRLRETFECRIPIPFGKEREAEIIMTRLRSHLLSAEQVWLGENFALGHDFSMGVCRKCGETIMEAASYIHRNCRGL